MRRRNDIAPAKFEGHHRARPYSCFVLERRNSAIMLPKLYIVPLDELLGIFHRGLIVGAHKSNCSADKTVFVHDVSSILGHIGVTPNHRGPHQSRAVCPAPDSETLMFGLAEAKAFIVLRRAKKVRPRISPRPDPIGTGYIRPCFQLLHCVTLIAAVNECPLQLSVAGRSMQHRQAPAR